MLMDRVCCFRAMGIVGHIFNVWKHSLLLLLIIFLSEPVFAGVGEWKTYTAMKNVRDVAVTQNTIWAASSGGLFRFQLSDSSFLKITNSEGLSSNDVNTVALDQNGNVWAGAANGAVDVYDVRSKTWWYIRDIFSSNLTQKGIYGFLFLGDSVFIATDFGVSLFLRARNEFRETYSKFGSSPSQVKVTTFLINNGKLWVGTNFGLAIADLTNPNLIAPEAWTNYTTQNGLPSNSITTLSAFQGKVYAGTSAGLAVWNGVSWQVVSGFVGTGIQRLAASSSVLYVAVGSNIRTLAPDNSISNFGSSLSFPITSLALDEQQKLYVGLDGGGMAFLSGQSWTYKFPNGPASNLFTSLVVDSQGVFWSASGISGRGQGFYSLNPKASEGNQWTNYSFSVYPQLQFDDYYLVSLGINSSKWVSSWGRGLALVDAQGQVKHFDRTNAGFFGIANDTTFIVIGNVAADRRGNTWTTVLFTANANVIAVMTPDSTWLFFRNVLNPTATFLTGLTIDFYDTKWIISSDPGLKGLLFFNDNGTLTNTADDQWGVLTNADGLSSKNINRVIVDLEGEIWLGTDLGLNVILNPRSPRGSIRRIFIAREQFINDIAVDPLNNKWLGTKEGVFVLSADGTSLLAQYTVANTDGKLIDNDVKAVAFDGQRGIVYFGTEKGLSSLTTTSVTPKENFENLTISPNPYRLPSPTPLQIDGLVRNSNIKILSIDGKVVKDLQTPGGRIAFWDGTNQQGEFVSTGIYLVVAFSPDGDQVSKGKVAVIRR